MLIEEWSFELSRHIPPNARKVTDDALKSWVTAFLKRQKAEGRLQLAALHEQYKSQFSCAVKLLFGKAATQVHSFDAA